jgi:inosose dehydratase
MTVRLGINPIGWTNDDIPWLGDLLPLDLCLAQAAAAGFSGIELGRKFPRQPKPLRRALDRHGLKLVSGWYSARLLERSVQDEIAALEDHLVLHVALGAEVMVFAETTGETVGHVGAGASKRPTIAGTAQWRELGRKLTAVADHMAARGVRMAVHHHMGTVVQSAGDIDRLFDNCGESVGLLLDTGHLTYAGGDPVKLAQRYASRISHVHCKDVRRGALAAAHSRDASFSQAVIMGIFTVPSDGIVDFDSVFKVLAKASYSGWLVQEAEQDPRLAPPDVYARLGHDHMAALCRKHRLKLAA